MDAQLHAAALDDVKKYLGHSTHLVIFDFDGVIIDSEIMSLTELGRTFADFGIDLPFEDLRAQFLGASIKKIRQYAAAHGNTEDTSTFADIWYGRLFKRFKTELCKISGTEDVLDELDRRQVPYCIASGGSYERLGVALSTVKLTERFAQRVFSADSVEHGKPAPDLFLFAAQKMGVPPDQCLVIEDSPAGVAAAQAANIQSIGFVGGSHLDGLQKEHSELLLSKGAKICVSDLRDIITANDNP